MPPSASTCGGHSATGRCATTLDSIPSCSSHPSTIHHSLQFHPSQTLVSQSSSNGRSITNPSQDSKKVIRKSGKVDLRAQYNIIQSDTGSG
ncbi:predicted protein [Botrytis cinerea T4]|uniref:Uncharacterized protein n=1 Tax=Botryotinia fuckeliana (strain T4) TaxID=999810 RepID=G2XSF9_BOTF4|nr:predicted protein [Botrytis cinerea T4]